MVSPQNESWQRRTRLAEELRTTLAALDELGPAYEAELAMSLVERLHTERIASAAPNQVAAMRPGEPQRRRPLPVIAGLAAAATLLLFSVGIASGQRTTFGGHRPGIAFLRIRAAEQAAAPLPPVAPAPPVPPVETQ